MNNLTTTPKKVRITLANFYNSYHYLDKDKISEIITNVKIYICPMVDYDDDNIAVTKAIASCKCSDISDGGIIPLKCKVNLPRELKKYSRFYVKLVFFNNTFLTNATVNQPSSVKLSTRRFDTTLELTLTKSTG